MNVLLLQQCSVFSSLGSCRKQEQEVILLLWLFKLHFVIPTYVRFKMWS